MTDLMRYPVLDCLRCGNQLLHKELKAQAEYCESCRKIKEADEHRKRVEGSLNRANGVVA